MALSGGLPSALEQVTVSDLEARFGPATVQRGTAYHRRGAVRHLRTDGGVVAATVQGTRRYQTVVESRAKGGSEVTTACSCPVGEGCKHAVAVILTAQAQARVAARLRGTRPDGIPQLPWRGEAPRPSTPAWETVLTPFVQEPTPRVPTGRPLGMLVEPELGRLRLRPVKPGSSGSWVRSGISWDEIPYAHHHGYDSAQLAALRAVLVAQRSAGYAGYGRAAWVEADAFGSDLWRLLDDLVGAGVTLVTGRQGLGPVHLAEAAASIGLDVTRAPDGSLRLRPLVTLPDGLSPDGLHLIGTPPHGLWTPTLEGLALVRLDRPAEPTVSGLLQGADEVVVPADDEARFLATYYPVLRRALPVTSSDASVTFPVIAPPRLGLTVTVADEHVLRLRWCFRYAVDDRVVEVAVSAGRHAHGLPGHDGQATDRQALVLRDTAAEESLLAGLDVLDAVSGLRARMAGTTRVGVVAEPELEGWATASFVEQVLPVLLARDDVDIDIVGDLLDYEECEDIPLIELSTHDLARDTDGAAAGESEDWFDLGISVTVGDEEVPLGALLTALARHEERLILPSGTWFSLDVPELQALRRIVEEARALQDHPSESMRINRFQVGLWEELLELGVVAQQSERWAASVGALLTLSEVPHPEQPPTVTAELRGYQLEGYQWLAFLWDHALGGVLADDMGLGKTLQTLTMAERARLAGELTPEEPLLVVAPTSVVSAWASEAARFTPELRVVTVTHTVARARRPLTEVTAGAHVVVTSYALLRIDGDHYCSREWAGLVLDEAQFVKNHQTKAYQVARRVRARMKLAITGTPLENSLMDLWALLSIVAPGLFPAPQRFTEIYRRPIERGGSAELLATLRRRVRPLMLRRTKQAVAADLPPKIEQVVSVPLSPQHRRIYDTHLQRERQRILGLLDDVDRNRIEILSALTTLRQLSLDVHLVEPEAPATIRSSKVDALLDQIVEVAAEGHRCLVFSQFTRFLGMVRERLTEAGIDQVYLDGSTRDRPARIAQFRDGDAPVFLISLKAGGSGLTLTEADYVFVLDPWWNPAVEAQAVDRTHRIGQDKTVMVYRLVSEDTVEEKVVALQQRKRDLFTRVVDDGGLLGAPLTADDIRGLLDD